MGNRYKCSKCGNESFEIYLNVYSKALIPEEHIEIVCDECDFGVPIITNLLKSELAINQLNKNIEKNIAQTKQEVRKV